MTLCCVVIEASSVSLTAPLHPLNKCAPANVMLEITLGGGGAGGGEDGQVQMRLDKRRSAAPLA